MAVFLPVWVIAYMVGGITFIPSLLLFLLSIRLVFSFCQSTIPLEQWHYEHCCHDGATRFQKSGGMYKTGWLRVTQYQQPRVQQQTISRVIQAYIYNSKSRDDDIQHIYFCVLKYSTLFLYDSHHKLDCIAVIQLHNYNVTMHPSTLRDGELFNRPNLIKLTPHHSSYPEYYINCHRNIDKEDWYLLFRQCNHHHHQPSSSSEPNDDIAIHKLITVLHSNAHHFETQWFNAMLGRLFCAVYQNDTIQQFLYNKLVAKLDKVNQRRPPFLGAIQVRSVDPGHQPPYLTHPRLLSLESSGELVAEAHLEYAGGIQFEIETQLLLTGSRKWRVRLPITLNHLEGMLMFHIKPPPTNRRWYAFQTRPSMSWHVDHPWDTIARTIRSKMQELVIANLVLPNMDDITFYRTPNGNGGIFP